MQRKTEDLYLLAGEATMATTKQTKTASRPSTKNALILLNILTIIHR